MIRFYHVCHGCTATFFVQWESYPCPRCGTVSESNEQREPPWLANPVKENPMPTVIKNPSQKKCVMCESTDTRLVDLREDEFRGPLCREHLWSKTSSPIEKKGPKKKESANAPAPRSS